MAWDDGLSGTFFRIAASPDSPLRVLAGPGTGKTFALMRRAARFLEESANPEHMLVVTFTRTAAKDLTTQLRALNIPGADRVRAGTLHSFCFAVLSNAQVLRATGRVPRTLAEFEKQFLLLDIRGEQFGGMRDKEARLRAFEAAWARLQSDSPGWPHRPRDRAFHRELTSWLLFHQAILVGELVPVTLAYLRNNPACPERRYFRYLLVDEYQDLNRAEQIILDVLGENANVCVVGDDDQSIYSFKFAHPEGIIEYPNDHPGTTTETLDVCRRCPAQVIDMANSLIRSNDRIQRQLHPRDHPPRGDVWAVQWDTLEDETEGLARAIVHAVRSRNIPPEHIIVLTARRLIGYRIRDALRSLGIPALSFFSEQALDNEESQERFTLLMLFVNPTDRVALRCWLGFSSTSGLPGSYAALRRFCEQNGQAPMDVLEQLATHRLQIPGTGRLIARYRILQRSLARLRGLTGAPFVTEWLPPDNNQLDELRNMAIRVLQTTQDPARILDELRYLITQPELPESPDSVRVMSLHKSKGLTARMVVIAGAVDGVLPHIDRDLDSSEQDHQLQEQRRLFYVAITRSSGTLVISSPLLLDRHTAFRIGALTRRTRGANAETIFTQFYSEFGDFAPQVLTGDEFFQQFTARVGRP